MHLETESQFKARFSNAYNLMLSLSLWPLSAILLIVSEIFCQLFNDSLCVRTCVRVYHLLTQISLNFRFHIEEVDLCSLLTAKP